MFVYAGVGVKSHGVALFGFEVLYRKKKHVCMCLVLVSRTVQYLVSPLASKYPPAWQSHSDGDLSGLTGPEVEARK